MVLRILKHGRLAVRTAAMACVMALSLGAAVDAAQAKTYLVNGILSATPIGYGFKNLKKKIPGASLFLMVSGIEAGQIRKTIADDIRKRHAANPDEQFVLAGISKGADVVLQIAADVAQDNIPIAYLAIVEGNGGSVPANVQSADNFICAKGGGLCAQAKVAGANTIPVDTGHIDMGNNELVHSRVVANAR
jgi:hypothetical protein